MCFIRILVLLIPCIYVTVLVCNAALQSDWSHDRYIHPSVYRNQRLASNRQRFNKQHVQAMPQQLQTIDRPSNIALESSSASHLRQSQRAISKEKSKVFVETTPGANDPSFEPGASNQMDGDGPMRNGDETDQVDMGVVQKLDTDDTAATDSFLANDDSRIPGGNICWICGWKQY